MDAINQMVTETVAGFLEKAQRPGLLGLVGKTAVKKCQRDLATYFRSLGARIKEMKFQDLAHPTRGLDAEHAKHMVEMRMHNLLRNRRPILSALLKMHLANGVQQANAISLLAESDDGTDDNSLADSTGDSSGTPAEVPGLSAQEAANWADTHVDETIQGLDDTSLDLVADAVSTGIQQQLGVQGTAGLIQDLVDRMVGSRTEAIANTEMNMAMNYGFMEKLRRNSIEYKQWILGPNPCETCEENAAASPIPVDEDFPSGDDAPPAHPNCVCAIAGARGPQ